MAVLWRHNEDDAEMDGELVVTDKDHKEKLEMKEHVTVAKRVYITRADLDVFGFTARCLGCVSLLEGTARQAHTLTAGRNEQRRTRKKDRRMHQQPQRVQAAAATASSSSSSGDGAKTGSSGEGNGPSRVDKRKADGEHPEDPERDTGSG